MQRGGGTPDQTSDDNAMMIQEAAVDPHKRTLAECSIDGTTYLKVRWTTTRQYRAFWKTQEKLNRRMRSRVAAKWRELGCVQRDALWGRHIQSD
jgi:hypothetical protein